MAIRIDILEIARKMRRQEKQKPCRDVIRAFVSGESLHTRTDHMQISLDSASAMNFNETSGTFRYFVGLSHQFFQKVDQKECFRGVFEHHKAHPIYRDISLTIMRRLKLISYWADWAPGIGNIRYYRDILVSIGPLMGLKARWIGVRRGRSSDPS